MNHLNKPLAALLCAFIYSSLYSAKNNTEVLTVKHYDGLIESLEPSVASKVANAKMESGYKSFYAKNNGDISLKSKNTAPASGLATTTFENPAATNSSSQPGPTDRNTTYELMTSPDQKEYFSEVAFLDSNTIVTISYTKKNAWLLLVDISNNPMQVTSRLSIPYPAYCHSVFSADKEKFYIEPNTHKIIIPVNKTTETVDNTGNLSWKKSKDAVPGVWIITPVKNEDKRWVIDKTQISVNYFSNDALNIKGKKDAFRIQTAHADNSGNIWMSFTRGIIGVLPVHGNVYEPEVLLYNFNRDGAWYEDMIRSYKRQLYADLKGSYEGDTMSLLKGINRKPQSYGGLYLENARYRLSSNLEKEKNAKLDTNAIYENPELLMKYVHINLDNPMDKKKAKKTAYLGFTIHQFHTIHNSITSGSDNSVYVTTNLGLYKLSYDEKLSSLGINWSTEYKNSFLKTGRDKRAASGTTPTFIEDRNEVVICDNDFPQINMLVVDATSGKIKQKFSLFEYAYGSACENSVAYSNHTIVVGNTFGNGHELKDQDDIPAGGVMKFSSIGTGNWRADYDWNKLHYYTIPNTAAPKISAPDGRLYIYHQPDEAKEWQLSSLPLNKADKFNPILYSLQPDYKGVVKTDINNFRSNLTIGPKKTIFIGTAGGLLRVRSE